MFLNSDFGSFIPFRDGFLNFKFLNLPNILETLFFGSVLTFSSTFSVASFFNGSLLLFVDTSLFTGISALMFDSCVVTSATGGVTLTF